MKVPVVAFTVLAALACVTTVFAKGLIIDALDKNLDCTIDAIEIDNASLALLTLDINGDGILTRDEIGFAPLPGKGSKARPKPSTPIMVALDVNADCILNATEIANASSALLTLDINGDGILTRDEFSLTSLAICDGSGKPGDAGRKRKGK